MNANDAVGAAVSSAQAMLRSGNAQGALTRLQQALQEHPGAHDLHLNLAMAQRTLGNLPAAVTALNDALAADPYSFLALLSKGAVLEQMADSGGASIGALYKQKQKFASGGQILVMCHQNVVT